MVTTPAEAVVFNAPLAPDSVTVPLLIVVAPVAEPRDVALARVTVPSLMVVPPVMTSGEESTSWPVPDLVTPKPPSLTGPRVNTAPLPTLNEDPLAVRVVARKLTPPLPE